jgi:hypothetical protein
MKDRCCDVRHRSYASYGGRGITVCDRWTNSFKNFLADMGERPSREYTIDRLDSLAGYHPGNCRWATKEQQAEGRKFNRVTAKNRRFIVNTSDGPVTLRKYLAPRGLPYRAVWTRLINGAALGDAIAALGASVEPGTELITLKPAVVSTD